MTFSKHSNSEVIRLSSDELCGTMRNMLKSANEKGINNLEFVRSIGISISLLKQIRAGIYTPSTVTLLKASDFLGKPLSFFFPRAEQTEVTA